MLFARVAKSNQRVDGREGARMKVKDSSAAAVRRDPLTLPAGALAIIAAQARS
jgi:hypothetical protein